MNKSDSLKRSYKIVKVNHRYFGFQYIPGEENKTETDRSNYESAIQHSRYIFREFEKERTVIEENCKLLFQDDIYGHLY